MGEVVRPPPMRELVEAARVAALHSHGALEIGAAAYDEACHAAAAALDATAAVVSFLDRQGEWVKGRFGADMPDGPRHLSFSHHVIHEPDGVLAVADLQGDARFSALPAVQGGALHRSYAGVSIVDPGEYRIGVVAVLDRRRRHFGPDSLEALRRMAIAVMDSLLPPRTPAKAAADAPAIPLRAPAAAPVDVLAAAPRGAPLIQGWLGVRTERALTSLSAPPGLLVVSLAESGPAARAGLLAGDLLFAIGDQAVRESGDITRALNGRPAGQAVPVHVWRAGAAAQCVIQVEPIPDGQRTRRRSSTLQP